MGDTLNDIIDLNTYPLDDQGFIDTCCKALSKDGVVMLPGFLQASALERLKSEGEAHQDQAFFTQSQHSVYLSAPNSDLPPDHAFNRQVVSSKGCICTDQIPTGSPLSTLYQSRAFKTFIAAVVGVQALYPYADKVSGINLHYAPHGKELGWHFDNSEFAITLLIQKPAGGGEYQYIKDLRDAEAGEMNFDDVTQALDGQLEPTSLDIAPGTLVLFRGRNSLHRVTPTQGDITRMLAVLAYNTQAGVALSESARMTFFGRLG